MGHGHDLWRSHLVSKKFYRTSRGNKAFRISRRDVHVDFTFMDTARILGDGMEIADKDAHHYSGMYPCRVPVWWARFGEPERHPNLAGVTGRKVILRIEKRFNRFERMLAKIFRAPREVRRPLDPMNSMLWELCNGSRTFEEICEHMDDVFQEDMAPVVDRTAAGIDALKRRNLMTVLTSEFTHKWSIQPGEVPAHQPLAPLDGSMKIDASLVDGDEQPTDEPQDAPMGDQ